MYKTIFTIAILSAAMFLLVACDQRAYRPNADPLGLEDSETTPESTDLPELPTLSDVEQQPENDSPESSQLEQEQ